MSETSTSDVHGHPSHPSHPEGRETLRRRERRSGTHLGLVSNLLTGAFTTVARVNLTRSLGLSNLGHFAFLLLAFVANCGGEDDTIAAPPSSGGTHAGSGGTSAGGASGQDSAGEANGDAAGAAGEQEGEPADATQLVPGSASMVGVTNDGWAIFRAGDALQAKEIGSDDEPETISEEAGTVVIEGRTVFNWTDVDWTENVGDLSIWTHEGGAHSIGETVYSEGLVAASEDGEFIVYPADVEDETMTLRIASNDFDSDDPLLEEVGVSSDETCGPNLGFVGERLVVGWCEAGTREARIERFEHGEDGWDSTLIAKDTLGTWSADASGDRIFYQGSDYVGYFNEDGDSSRVDGSISRGFITPDGSAVLYTVADQLRRSPVPEAAPIPIVTTGFAEAVSYSAGYTHTLYSSKVTYEKGTQRDLRLASTDQFNPEPIEIVSDPVATIGRSSMTTAGHFVFYSTDVKPTGGTLHVVDLEGNEVFTRKGVVDVAAAGGDAIVFSDNSSDPEVYPVVADLKYLDLAAGTTPKLIEAAILDGKSFRLDTDQKHLIYPRSGVGRDASDPERDGLYWIELPL